MMLTVMGNESHGVVGGTQCVSLPNMSGSLPKDVIDCICIDIYWLIVCIPERLYWRQNATLLHLRPYAIL